MGCHAAWFCRHIQQPQKETTDYADRESPSLVLNAESELHDQKQAKSSSIDGIASKRG